jgi:hypothetical protein
MDIPEKLATLGTQDNEKDIIWMQYFQVSWVRIR